MFVDKTGKLDAADRYYLKILYTECNGYQKELRILLNARIFKTKGCDNYTRFINAELKIKEGNLCSKLSQSTFQYSQNEMCRKRTIFLVFVVYYIGVQIFDANRN